MILLIDANVALGIIRTLFLQLHHRYRVRLGHSVSTHDQASTFRFRRLLDLQRVDLVFSPIVILCSQSARKSFLILMMFSMFVSSLFALTGLLRIALLSGKIIAFTTVYRMYRPPVGLPSRSEARVCVCQISSPHCGVEIGISYPTTCLYLTKFISGMNMYCSTALWIG